MNTCFALIEEEERNRALTDYGSGWGCCHCLHSSNWGDMLQSHLHSFSFPRIGEYGHWHSPEPWMSSYIPSQDTPIFRAKRGLEVSVTHLKELEGRMPVNLTMTLLPQERNVKILSLSKMSSYSYFTIVPQRHTLLIKTLLQFTH